MTTNKEKSYSVEEARALLDTYFQKDALEFAKKSSTIHQEVHV